MPEFTLPSGLVVEVKLEPTYGEECHLAFIGMDDPEKYHFAKFAVMCPGLSRPEIEALGRADGRALAQEVNKRLAYGRADADEIPFDKTSLSPSRDTTSSPDSPPSDSENSVSVSDSIGAIPS